LYLYDLADGKRLGHFQWPGKESPSDGFFSPSGKVYGLAAQDNPSPESRITCLFSVPSCELLCQLPFGFESRQRLFYFSGDDRHVAGFAARGGEIQVAEVSTGKIYRRLAPSADKADDERPPASFSRTAAFSPGGNLLATYAHEQPLVRLWDLAANKEIQKLSLEGRLHRDRVALAWSPDARMLAVGDRKILQLYEVASGKLRREFTGHEGDVRCLAFSPDGRLLASGSTDTTVLIWDVWGK
jgi:WD40 repeat protein